MLALWPGGDSDSEPDENEAPKPAVRGTSDLHLERNCSDLYEDDEDSEAAPMYECDEMQFNYIFRFVSFRFCV